MGTQALISAQKVIPRIAVVLIVIDAFGARLSNKSVFW
ncbi:hypothetical protein VCHENC01_3960 [Vibrio harveyi]|nr:hypothetical protein VCHENC01_3960 [Vibrio harveyi]